MQDKIQPEKLDLAITLSVPLNQSYECYQRLGQLEALVRDSCVSEDRFALLTRIKKAREKLRLEKEAGNRCI